MKKSIKLNLLFIAILLFGSVCLKAQVVDNTVVKLLNNPPTKAQADAKEAKAALHKVAKEQDRLVVLQQIVSAQPNLKLNETKLQSVNTTIYDLATDNKTESQNIPAASLGFINAQKIINSVAKVMVTGPEQNCSGAIPVCAASYTQSTSYTGAGTIQELSSTCLGTDETNSVWYTFTAQSSGTFGFLLNTVKDYDWALYNITTIGCAGVPSAVPVRCNWSGTEGVTGMSTATVSTESPALSEGGAGVPISNGISNMVAGNTYALIIDNYSADAAGYDLTFSGTATIADVTPPTINPPSSVVNNCNGTFTLKFSEPVQCNSIAANGSDFTLTGGGVITAATGVACSAGVLTNSVTINYSVPSSGTFILGVATGTDTNTILDKCNNAMATTQTVTINTLNALTLTANVNQICTAGSPVILTAGGAPNSVANIYTLTPGSAVASSNGSGNATFTVNPAATTTYVVLATFAGCTRSASVTITVPTSILAYINPVNPTICSGTAVLTAYSLVNGVLDAGATFTWSGGSTATTASITAAPGTYSVRTISSAGCVGTNTATSIVSLASAGAGASCNIFYASPGGGGSGLIKTSPTTLQNALTLALCQSATIKMAVGTYNLTDKVDVNSYVTIEGGYDAAYTTKTSDKSSGGSTRIVRSSTSADSDDGAGKRYTAFKVAPSATAFRFQDLRIEMPATHVAGSQKTNYAIYLSNGCSSYNIVRCYIDGGVGGSGTYGTAGTAGGNGGAGVATVAGVAGVGGGGAGGAGGAGSTGTNNHADGSAGTGGAGGAKSSSADYNSSIPGVFCLADLPSNPTMHASDGANGTVGTAGTAGTAGSFAGGLFIPGGSGTNGTSGTGGGGGGGAAKNTGEATNGGGGGGGGAGGTGGTGGSGGGSAFGIFSVAKGAGGTITDCQIYATAGVGGTGAGGAGGIGGPGADQCKAGDGGTGGNGGGGGAGGSGANGIAYAVCDVVGAVATNAGYISKDLINQPLITATNFNCTNTTISNTHAVGESCTSLGANASLIAPALPTTVTPITNQYTATSRKTIDYSGGGTGNVSFNPAQTWSSGVLNIAIPDNNCAANASNIIAVSGYSCNIASSGISITLNIAHDYTDDVRASITAPDGTSMILIVTEGTSGDNFTNTVFSDAGVLLSSGAPPFTGTFKPNGTTGATVCSGDATATVLNIATFGAFGGGSFNPNGNWKLQVWDLRLTGSGTFLDWSISFPSTTCSAGIYKTYTDFTNITMAPPSSGTILGASPLCNNTSGNFASSLGAAPGFTYLWSVINPAGTTSTITASTTNSTGITFTNPLATAQIFTVNTAVTSECCGLLTAPTQFTVSVTPGPAAPTVSASANPICPGTSSTLNATAPAGAAFAWYNAPVAGTLLSSTAIYAVTPAVTTIYYAQATSTLGCPGLRTAIEVTVAPTAAPTAPGVSNCVPGNVTIDVTSPIAGATYKWYTGSCGGALVQSSISTALTVNIPTVQVNTYYVSVIAPGCAESACTTVTAAITTAPASVFWTGAGTTGLNNWFYENNWASSGDRAAATFTNSDSKAVLADANCPAANQSTIAVSGYTLAIASSSITVRLTTSHSADISQLSIFLTAPNGSILGLTDNRGPAASCTFSNVLFTDAGSAAMTNTCPTTGQIFDPESAGYTDCAVTATLTSFGAIGGGSYIPNGTWTLTIVDNTNSGAGTGGAIAVAGWTLSMPSNYQGQCVPSCATDVTIPATPALAVSNPPDIGFTLAGAANAKTLTLATGNTLSMSAGKAILNVCGDFIHNGNFRTSNSTNGFSLGRVVFMGTVGQTYNNSNAPSNTTNFFNNVILNNTAGTPALTVSNKNMTLGTLGAFTFQSGKLLTTAADTLVILNGAPVAVNGHAATRYVGCTSNTNGQGNIKRYIQASGLGSYDFPVGQATYELVNINFTTAPTTPLKWLNANFQTYATVPTSPVVTECGISYNMAALDNGFWDIICFNNTSNNTGVYDMTLFNTGYTNAGAAWSIMSRHNGSATWAMPNGSGSSGVCVAGPVTAVVRKQMNGFSKFGTAQSSIPLPIELLSFTAKYNGKSADINWETATEINNDYFVIEKSTDAIDFTFLKQVDSKATNGNSSYNIKYAINDPDVISGTYYYRLKQYDFNGTATYSHIESINIGQSEENNFTVIPNPTAGSADVSYFCYSNENAVLRVYDDRGRLVIEQEISCLKGQNKSTINLNGKTDGLYLITLTTSNTIYKTKLVKHSN